MSNSEFELLSLKGTTWVFNNKPSNFFSTGIDAGNTKNLNVAVSLTGPSLFVCDGVEYDKLVIGDTGFSGNFYTILVYYDTEPRSVYQGTGTGWEDEKYKTITFLEDPVYFSGSDGMETKESFMEWLLNSAVFVPPALTGTSWKLKNTLSYPESFEASNTGSGVVFFTSNGNEYGTLSWENDNDECSMSFDSTTVYNDGEITDGYGAITFQAEPAEGGWELWNWLNENAIKFPETLTGIKWLMNATLTPYQDDMNVTEWSLTAKMDSGEAFFDVNGESYKTFTIQHNGQSMAVHYVANGVSQSRVVYSNGSWGNYNDRIITFSDDPDSLRKISQSANAESSTLAEFISWIIGNATPIEETTMTDDAVLTVDPVVSIDVDVSTGEVPSTAFDVGAVLTYEMGGVEHRLTTTNRYETYCSLNDVKTGNGGSSPAFDEGSSTYKFAAKYFSVSPAPGKLIVILKDSSETATNALNDAIEKGADFYGLSTLIMHTDSELQNIVGTLNSRGRGVFFYQKTNAQASSSSQALVGADRAIIVVSDNIVYPVSGSTNYGIFDVVPGMMGVAMGLARTHATRGFALCFKNIPTAEPVVLTQSQVDTFTGNNYNVYVSRTRTHAGLENGALRSGKRFDELFFTDKICAEIQAGLYATITDEPDKLPQTDSTTQLFINEIYRILNNYYTGGVLATQPWRGQDIGNVLNGDIIEHGYLAFADSFDNQTTADRAAHKAMPITVLLCLSGSVESVEVHVHVRT